MVRLRELEEKEKKERTRAVSMAKRRARQADILEDMQVRLGLTPSCRDVGLLRVVLTHGVYKVDLAAFLGVTVRSVDCWLTGQKTPKPVAP